MSEYLDANHWRVAQLVDTLQAAANDLENLQIIEKLKPILKKDGNEWCYIIGEMPENYLSGFGNTPREAMYDFCKNFSTEKP